MRPKLFLFLLLCFGVPATQAQVSINTDASAPDGSAMLDIKSTAKGFLAPRMTSAQRTAIAAPAEGLWVYDTDTHTFWFYLTGGWQQVTSGGFSIPYAQTYNYALPLFSLTNSGAGGAAAFSNNNSSATANVLNVTSITPGVIADHSTGNAGNFFVDNTNGVGAGVRGEVNSIFGNNGTAGIYGTASGTGGYGGYFEHSNATGYGYALFSTTRGQGSSAWFESTLTTNTQPTLTLYHYGLGDAISAFATNVNSTANVINASYLGPGVISDHSSGNAGNFVVNNTYSVGAGVRGETNSIFGNNGSAGVYGVASGTGGYGGYFTHTAATGFGNALYAINEGQGTTVAFVTDLATNSQPTLQVTNIGSGTTVDVSNSNVSNAANTLNVKSFGPGVIADHSKGNTANFVISNTYGVGAGVRGETNSIFGNYGSAGVYGVATGTGGYGGFFEHAEETGYGNALFATGADLGTTVGFETTNASNAQPTLNVKTVGTGGAISASSSNSSGTANILNVVGMGPGVIADHSTGNAGNFLMNNTYGVGAGVRGEVNSIFGNDGTAGVYGVASGTGGYGGYFEHTETTGYGIALQVITNDLGSAMVVNSTGTGNLAVFQHNYANVARITNAGAGLFNGGLAAGGADLAEAFDVEGPLSDYTPGDVLLISTRTDRALNRSTEAYSALVAGVYASRPGLLLAEDSVSKSGDGKVPLGVVGVLPTKVCNENGPIHRGDILVTSSRTGYAMRADPDKLKPGQSIGKALAAFSGETGMIKVLVNVK